MERGPREAGDPETEMQEARPEAKVSPQNPPRGWGGPLWHLETHAYFSLPTPAPLIPQHLVWGRPPLLAWT